MRKYKVPGPSLMDRSGIWSLNPAELSTKSFHCYKSTLGFVPRLWHGCQSRRDVRELRWIRQSRHHHFKRIENACKSAPAVSTTSAKESLVLLWTEAQRRQSRIAGKKHQPAANAQSHKPGSVKPSSANLCRVERGCGTYWRWVSCHGST